MFIYRYRWHVLFWLVYIAGWTFFSLRVYHESLVQALAVVFAYGLGQGPLIYLTIYRWVPRFLKPRKTTRFLLRAAAGLLVSAGFTTTCVYLLLGSRLGMTAATLGGYVLLGNTYWILLAVGAVMIRDRYQGERDRAKSELTFLKSQMNPHFLFNALNSIYVLIRKDPDLAEHTLAGFSDMLRYQLYECASDHISVDREVTYLENFIRLERLRKGETLTVHYEKPLGFGGFPIAPLLIFPLVENAFKYVSSSMDKTNEVSVRLSYAEPLFEMVVTNSMDQRDAGRQKKSKEGGIGLRNLRRRLALLYPGRHTLTLSQTPDRYSATLQVQVI